MSETGCVLTSFERAFGVCAPTDAISDEPGEAIAVLRELGLRHCELRSIGNVALGDLPVSRQRELGELLRAEGMVAVLLDSDVGQVGLEAEFGQQMARLERLLDAARELGAPAVRVFSFLVAPEGPTEAGAGIGRKIADRLRQMADRTAESRVMLLVENLPASTGRSGARLGELLERVRSPWIGAAFDPAGFVAEKEHPFLGALMPGPLKNYVRCLRIRDARFEDRLPVVPDQGNGDLRELVSALIARSFDGYFSLDFGLPPSPASFRAGFRAFQAILGELL